MRTNQECFLLPLPLLWAECPSSTPGLIQSQFLFPGWPGQDARPASGIGCLKLFNDLTGWAGSETQALFFFFFFCLFRAVPAAYASFQARGRIGARAASLCHSHSNPRSKPHLQPQLPQLTATWDP